MGARLSYPSVALKNKVAVVTGGNQGIGYSTAKALAAMGSHVIIACRSEERATQAIEKMKQEVAAADPDKGTINVEFLPLDLSSFESTKHFARLLVDKGLPVNILILNAGIANMPFAKTGDGFEQIFQVNYLSHFLLTLLLLPVLKSSAPDTRIIILSSMIYTRGVFNPRDIEGTASYSAFQSYNNTKLFAVMMMFSLQKRLAGSGVSVFSIDPGFVETNMSHNFVSNAFLRGLMNVMHAIGVSRSTDKGAATSLNAAVNPEFAGQEAVFFVNCKPTPVKEVARNEESQEQLWSYSLNQLKHHLDVPSLAELGIHIPVDQPDGTAEDGLL